MYSKHWRTAPIQKTLVPPDSKDLLSFPFSLPIQTISYVQASIGALPPAKRCRYHHILEFSFPFFFFFFFCSSSSSLPIQTISVRLSHTQKSNYGSCNSKFEIRFASQRRCPVCGFVGKGLVHTAQSSPKCLTKCIG